MARTRADERRSFAAEGRRILSLEIAHRVNALGGYGPSGEVIYETHPAGCPSVLVDSRGSATATFMSNGSVGFHVTLAGGMEVPVLETSFDFVEKREVGVPSNNVWLDVTVGTRRCIASLINPNTHMDCPAAAVRLVKVGDPNRAMWYGATFTPARGVAYRTAVRFALADTPQGPALMREVYVENTGKRPITGTLWTCFNLHGTQQFVYNKESWYDQGLPVTLRDSVVCATLPYTDILQIKRVSSAPTGVKPVDATCDHSTFVGGASAFSTMPQAVVRGGMLAGGAGRQLNRFSTATVAANQFAVDLKPGRAATLQQALLYVTDGPVIEAFRRGTACERPAYGDIARAFKAAARQLVKTTPNATAIARAASAVSDKERTPFFQVSLPNLPVASNYANSVWMGVKELYETCRAHGAKLADGIELGTRDRGQDMWPKMKEDPGRVRADLVHALSFMYVTCEEPPVVVGRPLTLPEKLHGMFPRQYPSRWDDRTQEVANDNRPYTDSPLWLINSLHMYLRETGDTSILRERVKTIRLTDPEHPITSSIVGNDDEYTIAEVVFEVLACFERHADDSPYGMAQILYGDWCDPLDMFGTNPVGDPTSRGRGRGVQTRLAAHLFDCLVETIDTFEAPAVLRALTGLEVEARIDRIKTFADRLRQNIVTWAWEDGPGAFMAGFIDCIHEFAMDGSVPDYAKGEIGYTLGSMRGTDFDGINRRALVSQAWGLRMLLTQRGYLTPIDGADAMIAKVLRTADTLFYRKALGLVQFTVPVANNQRSLDLVGRMGVVPPGCAENGEYHHAQAMMHRFRLDVPGEADTVWQQFQPIMSALRDESIAGPFETPCNCYASDPADPHFGKAMYFGLSGSVDWIIEVFHRFAGLELALHDRRRPDVRVSPNLPDVFDHDFTFRRVIHRAGRGGRYTPIPLTIRVRKEGSGTKATETRVTINGQPAERAEVKSVKGLKQVCIEIVHVCGE